MSDDSIDALIQQLEGLRLAEQEILQRLVEARARETRGRAEPAAVPTGTVAFRVGDRVEITNQVRLPFGRTPGPGDRRGTVTKITAQRVSLVTANGSRTNRAPHNLRVIPDQAQ